LPQKEGIQALGIRQQAYNASMGKKKKKQAETRGIKRGAEGKTPQPTSRTTP
jgi:hypothetical protein